MSYIWIEFTIKNKKTEQPPKPSPDQIYSGTNFNQNGKENRGVRRHPHLNYKPFFKQYWWVEGDI